MEKWKIGVIATLLLGLVGYGISQQPKEHPPGGDATSDTKEGDASELKPIDPSAFQGKSIGTGIPTWKTIKPWANTKTPVSLSAMKGSVALVEVFRIDCPHCQDAAAPMEKLYERYAPRGLKMAAIQSPGLYKDLTNPENNWVQVQGFLKQHGVKYPVGFDSQSKWFQQTLKGTNYPTIMMFDRTGKATFSFTGHDANKFTALAANLEMLLPGQGTPEARATELTKWLSGVLAMPPGGLPGALTPDPALQKSLLPVVRKRMGLVK